MKPALKKTYKVLRAIIVSVIVTVVGLYALTYVLLSLPFVQNKIRQIAERELSKELNTNVTIGEISIKPFNQVMLLDVRIPDQQDGDMIDIDKIGAGISIYNLIRNQRIVLTYGEIIGMRARITRPDKDSPTNIQFLIDALKPKEKKKKKKVDVSVFNIVIRKSEISYDVLNEPRLTDRLDPNHLHVTNFCADLALPRITNDNYEIDLKRLSFDEQSGLSLDNLTANVKISPTELSASGVRVELPHSIIAPDDITLQYTSLGNLKNELFNKPLSVKLQDNSVRPSDFAFLVPALNQWTNDYRLTVVASGTPKDLNVESLLIDGNDLNLDLQGKFYNLDSVAALRFIVPHLRLRANAGTVARITSQFATLSPQVVGMLGSCGDLSVSGSAAGTPRDFTFDGKVGTILGDVEMNGNFAKDPADGTTRFNGHVSTPRLNIGTLLKEKLLGEVSLDSQIDAVFHRQLISAKIKGDIAYIDINGYRFQNIVADLDAKRDQFTGHLSINDPNGVIDLDGNATLAGKQSKFDVKLLAQDVNLSKMNLSNPYADQIVSFDLDASFVGNKIDNATGHVNLRDINYVNNGKRIDFGDISVVADNASPTQRIDINTDFVKGYVEGQYDFATLVPSVKGMLAQSFPALFGAYQHQRRGKPNDLDFHFVVEPTDKLNALAKLPVKLVYPATVDGSISESDDDINVTVDVPYLQQGNNIIEGTRLTVNLDNATDSLTMAARTLIPTKNGTIHVGFDANGFNDRLNTNVGWRYDRARDFHGDINVTAELMRDEDNKVCVNAAVNPTYIVANDTVWTVHPATITYLGGIVDVNSLSATCGKQFIGIDGRASQNPDDQLTLKLNDISLDYIFQTLGITHVQFGGRATGTFCAADVFSKSPRLTTEQPLRVKRLKYNGAVMGDALIESHWDNESKGVMINADIAQDNSLHSYVNGGIYPMNDSLYLEFDADKANVKFMKPYMEAFTSSVEGVASGHAVLLGNFHDINLYGDLFAENLKLKLDFTNVYYTCTDSVHIDPGYIAFNDVTLYDRDRHTAKLNGWLRHDNFHNPKFEFRITEAKDFLCYDTNEAINPIWYGTIYGNGGAVVKGWPGMVDISVDMVSAPRSSFTFVLSDQLEASDFNFLVIRDKNPAPEPLQASLAEKVNEEPEVIRQLRKKTGNQQQALPTQYVINLKGEITPDLQMILVMDPIGGDRIIAYGNGELDMGYTSTLKEKLEMRGKYTIASGKYNFTLQDVIEKQFEINNGSTITFNGDPYKAELDVTATYTARPSLRTLDKDIASRTNNNPPVNVILHANGPMQQPETSFDFDYPTLTNDTKSEILSFFSTEEMKQQQMIYILATDSYYPPEYMSNGASRNSGFSSLASSTISSKLSSMLGRLSDKWSIAPSFRSERGDFTDVEVDLTLSSNLLNNRLLFNGNIGYRDDTYKTRNTNFIGDFDIEYLLNDLGTYRLKAYNHFNDQDFYVRSALTTQGVGITVKQDFNNFRELKNLFRWRKKEEEQPAANTTPATAANDSIQQ